LGDTKKTLGELERTQQGILGIGEAMEKLRNQSEEVAKLPEDSQDELFHEIDLNKDGVLQYDEFRTIAQITEAQILSQQEQE